MTKMADEIDEGLLEEIKERKPPYNAGCSVGRALTQMDDKTAATFRAALKMPLHDVSTAGIAKALQARGFQIENSTVGRHRNGICRCE